MARMHARRRGQAGSKKPLDARVTWVRYTNKEIELLIAKLAKSGLSPSKIGLHLRDSYGIPDVRTILKKKVSAVLAEKNLSKTLPEDLSALIRRSVGARKHMTRNKKDLAAKHGIILIDSKIRRLAKYYKASGKLPVSWHFDAEKAELYVE